jgi:hypothetical protein
MLTPRWLAEVRMLAFAVVSLSLAARVSNTPLTISHGRMRS